MSTDRQPRAPLSEPGTEQVAEFLDAHPEFFETHAELVSRLRIPHPTSGEAISLIEKQVEILRSQNRQLERRLVDLIEVARLNEASVEKIHQLGVALLDAHDLNDVLTTVQDSLHSRFAADEVAICLFRGPGQALEGTPARRVLREDLEPEFANFLKAARPQCGRLRPAQLEWLFGERAERIASAALIPLGRELGTGLIAVGSHSEDQFSPTLGTVYLARIGELFTAALEPHLKSG